VDLQGLLAASPRQKGWR